MPHADTHPSQAPDSDHPSAAASWHEHALGYPIHSNIRRTKCGQKMNIRRVLCSNKYGILACNTQTRATRIALLNSDAVALLQRSRSWCRRARHGSASTTGTDPHSTPGGLLFTLPCWKRPKRSSGSARLERGAVSSIARRAVCRGCEEIALMH